ncbi:MAG: YjjG family noncanonical pyrimidine nucleotidase [Prevotella sp.]|jgi:putative hydrolase of the HAD superfamily|nr:YjjG family noncanonical pyrimidine nucleotidase [Prevotella sp.]
MKYNAILFDLDHTLLDTERNNRDALEEIYAVYGFDRHYESFEDFYAVYSEYNLAIWTAYENKHVTKNDMMYLRFYTPFNHLNGYTRAKALEINYDYLDRVAGKGILIDGATALLDTLKPHYPMHIISNGFNEVQYKKIDSAGLSPYFDKIILSDHIGVNKPDPALFRHALNEIGMTATEVVMIGDNWNSDILGAKNSGIDQIWYNPNLNKPAGFVPTYTVARLSEIPAILL